MTPSSKEMTIILIEDDTGQAELVKINFERGGLLHEVIHFTNGHRAMEFFSAQPSTHRDTKYLVILDINMPGMDGHQVLERIRDNALTRNIPVIMLTAADNEEEIGHCYALGCNLYVHKCINYDDFSETMRELGMFIQKARFPCTSALAA